MTGQAVLTEAQRAQLTAEGFCVVPGVLDASRLDDLRRRLWRAADESARRGLRTRFPELDPNDRNVRVFHLLELDPAFRELIVHPQALAGVRALLGGDFRISNFTANIARPGSGPMFLHSDLGLVAPEPWTTPGSVNAIWCLDGIREENGATRYLPGSHRITRAAELPRDAAARLVSFEAPAGALLLMDGRLWHTSGCNRTRDEDRALLFAYYSRRAIAPQADWQRELSPATRATLAPELADLLEPEEPPSPAVAHREEGERHP
ncbi:MAG: phytanoyl-CoA dioxygenase family protein [Pseudomonadales bacterium]|nr:phytanoyl-CoA dioxygenase family protein [Pseudomonadales bacterium]